MSAYWLSIAEKATKYFNDGNEVFAECGDGVTAYIAACISEQDAASVAGIMEHLRVEKSVAYRVEEN